MLSSKSVVFSISSIEIDTNVRVDVFLDAIVYVLLN